MTSLRHNSEPRDVYLDAARDCILDVGWRRTTLTEVAKRSGVSRMTIYRTWADMPSLLGDLMTREWGGVVTSHVGHVGHVGPAGGGGPVEQVVAGITATVRGLRDNELFVRIVEVDPELVLPYLFSRRGRSQELILELLAPVLAAGQADGSVRAGDPVVIARGLLLAVHGFVLSLQTMVDDEVTAVDLMAELEHVVRGAL